MFVHEKHRNKPELPRLAGWWGNSEKTRFTMPKNFVPQDGAAGWQVSNAPVLSMAAHKASLEIFDEGGMAALRKKSMQMTGFLEFLLLSGESRQSFRIITPTDPSQRGAQLSIQTQRDGKKLFQKITKSGVIADWREPDVIRVAPVPLYNTFEDVFRFAQILLHA